MTSPIVLVALDGSEHALVALPVARRLAELEAATLHIVHVARELATPIEVLARLGLSASELRGLVLETKTGDPASGIVEAARDERCRFLVLCTHTAAARPDRILGRTALAVLERAPCPIVLVRPDRGVVPWALRRVLLPHDGTPTTSAALHPAVELASKAGARLSILHVAAPGVHVPSERGTLPPPRYVDQPQHEWPAWAGEFIERVGRCCAFESLEVRMALAHGIPGDEILRAASAQEIDLIALVWRGRWGPDRAATARQILDGAACPVLVVRADGETPATASA
jgi:nucleotide-binding universal stress UspA family protein